jgi:putative hemolysin
MNLTDKNYDTIGGFMMGQLGRIPKVGDMVEMKTAGARLRVEEMDRLRVARVRLTRIPPQNGEGDVSPAHGSA